MAFEAAGEKSGVRALGNGAADQLQHYLYHGNEAASNGNSSVGRVGVFRSLRYHALCLDPAHCHEEEIEKGYLSQTSIPFNVLMLELKDQYRSSKNQSFSSFFSSVEDGVTPSGSGGRQ